MRAGYSTVVPNSGTTNVCHSNADWRLRICASAPGTSDKVASVPARTYFATAHMLSASRAAAAAMRDGRAVNVFAAHTFAGPAGMRRRAG
jgi:hypothetical protein